jgi:hypothetical protein
MTNHRYSIMVIAQGSDREVELLNCNANPEALETALRQKTLTLHRSVFEPGRRTVRVPQYVSVRIVDHGAEPNH